MANRLTAKTPAQNEHRGLIANPRPKPRVGTLVFMNINTCFLQACRLQKEMRPPHVLHFSSFVSLGFFCGPGHLSHANVILACGIGMWDKKSACGDSWELRGQSRPALTHCAFDLLSTTLIKKWRFFRMAFAFSFVSLLHVQGWVAMVLNTLRRVARKQLLQEAAGKSCLESPSC